MHFAYNACKQKQRHNNNISSHSRHIITFIILLILQVTTNVPVLVIITVYSHGRLKEKHYLRKRGYSLRKEDEESEKTNQMNISWN